MIRGEVLQVEEVSIWMRGEVFGLRVEVVPAVLYRYEYRASGHPIDDSATASGDNRHG